MGMRKIKVSWPDVETAFERNAPGLKSYVDCDTGEMIVLIEGAPEDAEKRNKITEDSDKYIKIEPASSKEQYRWMECFVFSVEEDILRDRLLVSIDGKGAFRRFKDALISYPAERERWFRYRADLLHYHINEWFKQRELEPDPPAPWGEVTPPPEPEKILEREDSDGEGPADLLRKQVKSLVDMLAAGELHSARVFLEYLRDRGSAELSGLKEKIDLRQPFRRYSEGSLSDLEDDSSVEVEKESEDKTDSEGDSEPPNTDCAAQNG